MPALLSENQDQLSTQEANNTRVFLTKLRWVVEVTNSFLKNAYKCYLQNLLNHGQDSKSTHMGSSIWEKVEASHFDSIDLEGSSCNQGFIDRYLLVKDSKLFDLYGRLHVDLLSI